MILFALCIKSVLFHPFYTKLFSLVSFPNKSSQPQTTFKFFCVALGCVYILPEVIEKLQTFQNSSLSNLNFTNL